MVRGKKPVPVPIKELNGNPGKRPLPDEPQPDRCIPAMPEFLPEEVQRLWFEYAPKLEELGLLTAVDGMSLAFLLLHYHFAAETVAIITRDGLVRTDENGADRKHPLFQVMRDNSMAYLRYAAEFGLTPSSRSRINVAAKPPLSIAEMLAQLIAEDEDN